MFPNNLNTKMLNHNKQKYLQQQKSYLTFRNRFLSLIVAACLLSTQLCLRLQALNQTKHEENIYLYFSF